MDEKDLIRKAKKGDTLALSKLLQRNYSFLLKYLMKATLHPQIAEDLTQETMMKCIEKIQLYNGKSKFSSWLITIATNLFIDQQRRKKREKNWCGYLYTSYRTNKRRYSTKFREHFHDKE